MLFGSTVGPPGAVKEYWDHIMHSDFVQKHPQLNDYFHTAPLGFHGDAGAFSKQDSLMVFSFNGLLSSGRTRTKRFLFSTIRKADYTRETLDAMLKVFSWSMNIMLEGLTPASNHNDMPTGEPRTP